MKHVHARQLLPDAAALYLHDSIIPKLNVALAGHNMLMRSMMLTLTDCKFCSLTDI